jgi:hypothetical protein
MNSNYIGVSNIAQKCIESKINIIHETSDQIGKQCIPSPYKELYAYDKDKPQC